MRSAMPPRVDEHQRRSAGSRRGSAIWSSTSAICSAEATASSSLFGSSIARSSARRCPKSTIEQSGVPSLRCRAAPTSSRAMPSIGRWVALSPMRTGRSRADVLQPFERQRQVRAALVARQRVDLVDDQRADARERAPAALGGQHQVERLGRGHQKVRRPRHELAARGRRACRRCAPKLLISGGASPSSRATSAISTSGRSRLCWMSTASAFSGDT